MNLASAEFSEHSLPGTHGVDYVYPDPVYAAGYRSASYYIGKGMTTFRLPFRWERLQRSIYGGFDSGELARLRHTVDGLTSLGAYVIVDPHNYARYRGALVGSAEVPNAALADFWSRLANEFKSNPRVLFGLMNEPYFIDTDLWVDAANEAIAAVRSIGADNLILVPGNRWTGAHSWFHSDEFGRSNSDSLLEIVDPGHNYAFEVHQYLDEDSSGTHSTCPTASVGSSKLGAFTSWLRENGARGFLGEFGAGSGGTCLAAIDDLLLHVEANTDVWLGWTYWAGGPWWTNYFTSLEPVGGNEVPQMRVIEKHLADPTDLSELPMDASGWVSSTSNEWGLQGRWYWFTDAGTGGSTQIAGLSTDAVPYVANGGMCLRGSTPGGSSDNYRTWGAGIGLNVNQAEGTTTSTAFPDGPRCYRITFSGSAPDGFRAKLLPQFPMPEGVEPAGIDVGSAGTFELCTNAVSAPSWCTSGSGACLDASSLKGGVASVIVQANAGASGGPIDYCIEKVMPHD